jgi:hypothetical protein
MCQSALKINPGSALNIDPAHDDGFRAMIMRLDGLGPVFEAPALVAGLDDVTVMGQPVQQRGTLRHTRRIKQFLTDFLADFPGGTYGPLWISHNIYQATSGAISGKSSQAGGGRLRPLT